MAVDENTVSFELFVRQQRQILDKLAQIRAEGRQTRTAFTSISDYISRLNSRLDQIEKRLIDSREDNEAMMKMEIGGGLANFETRIEDKVAALEARIDGKLDLIINQLKNIVVA